MSDEEGQERAENTVSEQSRPSEETKADRAAVRQKYQTAVGKIVLAMANIPRYRHQTLGDLRHLVIDPLTRDRIALANAKAEGHDETLAGIALWATVSDEVDRKISEQVDARVFPIRLKKEDWTSGQTVWLLDVIAPSRELATAVLRNFLDMAGGKLLKVHPIVARSVDPEVLEKMRIAGPGLKPGPTAEGD